MAGFAVGAGDESESSGSLERVSRAHFVSSARLSSPVKCAAASLSAGVLAGKSRRLGASSMYLKARSELGLCISVDAHQLHVWPLP